MYTQLYRTTSLPSPNTKRGSVAWHARRMWKHKIRQNEAGLLEGWRARVLGCRVEFNILGFCTQDTSPSLDQDRLHRWTTWVARLMRRPAPVHLPSSATSP